MNMDLEQQWKSMGRATETGSAISDLQLGDIKSKKPSSPLFKIIKSLETGMVMIIASLVIYMMGIIMFEPVFTRITLFILICYSVYCLVQSLKLRNQIDPTVIAGNSVKAELERHYRSLMQWCKTQERNVLFLYPVALAGGAILGMSEAGAKKMNYALQKPSVWIALACIVIVLMPLLYFINRRLMKASYYDHLEHLKLLIEMLEE